MPTKLAPAIIAALLLAAFAVANIHPYNHPTSCDVCHTPSGQEVTFTTGGSGTCDPSKQECVWSHVVLGEDTPWKQCSGCHTAITGKITGTPHESLQQTYGCACHAVAHVGYGNPTDGYVACIYYWAPKLSASPGYWGENPPVAFQRVEVCFKGTPGGTYDIRWGPLITTSPAVDYIKAKALKVGYSYDENTGEVTIYQRQAQLLETDFFSLLAEQFARYERNATVSAPHAITHTAEEGETIILGVYDIHDAAFILTVPYWKYGRYPYYLPAGVNPAYSACFNCHFVYQGQPGAAKVMEVGGLWKIGIPADVFNAVADPHAIKLPQAQAAGAAAPNLALVGLLATAVLLAGGFVVVKRRL